MRALNLEIITIVFIPICPPRSFYAFALIFIATPFCLIKKGEKIKEKRNAPPVFPSHPHITVPSTSWYYDNLFVVAHPKVQVRPHHNSFIAVQFLNFRFEPGSNPVRTTTTLETTEHSVETTESFFWFEKYLIG
jgi:hypothetical protein